MRRIRILLVWLPTLLRDILSDAVAREPDMEIVATAETRVELEAAVRRYQPDVVVTGSPGTDAGAVASEILQMAPSVVLVAIAQKGDRATLYSPGSDPLEILIFDRCAAQSDPRSPLQKGTGTAARLSCRVAEPSSCALAIEATPAAALTEARQMNLPALSRQVTRTHAHDVRRQLKVDDQPRQVSSRVR
jgi:hypothetical protein